MRITSFVLLLLLLNYSMSMAQNLSWSWLRGASTVEKAIGNDVKIGSSGNIYVIGSFYGSVQFDSTYVSEGRSDVFLVKYSPAGDIIWVKTFGGIGYDEGAALGLDSAENLYIGGSFSDTIYIDTFSLESRGAEDIYIAKIDSSGVPLWVKTAGSKTKDKIGIGGSGGAIGGGSSMTINKDQELIVAGTFIGLTPANGVDTAWFDTTGLSSGYSGNSFVAKYALSGALVWIRAATRGLLTTDVTSDLFGNVFLTGIITGGTATFDNQLYPSIATGTIFVAKYNASGVFQWVSQAGGPLDLMSRAVVTDTAGSCYLIGDFYATPLNFDWFSLPSIGGHDVFIAKYDSAGSFLWARNAGGQSFDNGNGIAVTQNGNVVVAGSFNQFGVFGPDTLTGGAGPDMFVAEYTPSGNYVGVTRMGGNGYDMVNAITIAQDGLLYVTGTSASDPCFFESHQVGITGAGMILAKGAIVTGIDPDPLESLHSVEYYPNPSDGRLYYQNLTNRSEQVQVINYQGFTVQEFLLLPGKNFVDLDLPGGNYIIKGLRSERKAEKLTILKN